ncbi:MAG: alpha/beta fold hydrolase [Acidimicrobiales bacterium]
MSYAEATHRRIAYDDSGGDGLPVVLGHGFLMNRSMFEPQVRALSHRYRVITWDARGFGETDYDGSPFTYWDLAADCLALLDHLCIERAVVGGMSQGGFSALRAALVASKRVAALILLDTQAGPEDPEVIPVYRGMTDDWVTNGPSDAIAEATAALILGQPELNREWIAHWRSLEPGRLAQPANTLFEREDLTDRLVEIVVPALVVHGTEDVSIGRDKAEALAAGLIGCSGVVSVPGGTHAANLTHPDLVNEAILNFLDQLDPPP